MCLNTGTPKNINFPFGTNGKLMTFDDPVLTCLNIGTPKNKNFSFWTKWKINDFRFPNIGFLKIL